MAATDTSAALQQELLRRARARAARSTSPKARSRAPWSCATHHRTTRCF